MFSQVLAAIPALEVDQKRKEKSAGNRNQVQYEVRFPPGSMGLELEPVIISSERQLGCRVKDYYFDVQANNVGDSRNVVTISSNSNAAGVGIGHIILKIDGEQVNSQSFSEILDKLKLLKDSYRTITFKNISPTEMPTAAGSGMKAQAHKGNGQPLSNTKSPSMKRLLSPSKTPTHQQQMKNSENTPNLSSSPIVDPYVLMKERRPTSSPRSTQKNRSGRVPLIDRASTTPNTNITAINVHSKSNSDGYIFELGGQGMCIPYADSGDSNVSPRAVKELAMRHSSGKKSSTPRSRSHSSESTPLGGGSGYSDSQYRQRRLFHNAATVSQGRLFENNSSSSSIGPIEPFSPPAQQKQYPQDGGLYNIELDHQRDDHHHQQQQQQQRQQQQLLQSLLMPDTTNMTNWQRDQSVAKHILGKVGSGLFTMGTVVGPIAVDAALTVGSVLTDHVENVMYPAFAESLPKYNSYDMTQALSKKNDLLNELSRSYVLLGEAEDRGSRGDSAK
jgi:hypothetical protein